MSLVKFANGIILHSSECRFADWIRPYTWGIFVFCQEVVAPVRIHSTYTYSGFFAPKTVKLKANFAKLKANFAETQEIY